MVDPLSAILTLPQSISALLDIWDRTKLERSAKATDYTDDFRAKIAIARFSLYNFSHFSDELEKWKDVHHNSQILTGHVLKHNYELCNLTEDKFIKFLAEKSELLKSEIENLDNQLGCVQLLRHYNSDKRRLEFKHYSALPSTLANYWENDWVDSIIALYTNFSLTFNNRRYDEYQIALLHFRKFCESLSICADFEIKHRVTELVSTLLDLRRQLDVTDFPDYVTSES